MSFSGSFFNLDEEEERRKKTIELGQKAIDIVEKYFLERKARRRSVPTKVWGKGNLGIHQSVGRVSKSKVASSSLESGYSSTASSATVHRRIKPVPEIVAEQVGQGDTKTNEDNPSLDQKNNDKKVTCNHNLEESD